jgi:hypothetical protein
LASKISIELPEGQFLFYSLWIALFSEPPTFFINSFEKSIIIFKVPHTIFLDFYQFFNEFCGFFEVPRTVFPEVFGKFRETSQCWKKN